MLYFGWGLAGTVGGLTGPVAVGKERGVPARDRGALRRSRGNIFTLDVTDADYHTLEYRLEAVSEVTGGTYHKTHLFPSLAMELVRKAISGRYVLWIVNSGNTRGDHTVDVSLVSKKGYVYARQYYQDR